MTNRPTILNDGCKYDDDGYELSERALVEFSFRWHDRGANGLGLLQLQMMNSLFLI